MSIMSKTLMASTAAVALATTGQAQDADNNDLVQVQAAFANAVIEYNESDDVFRFPNPNLGLKVRIGENCTVFAAAKFHADAHLNYQDTSLLGAHVTCNLDGGWQVFAGRELPGKVTEDARSVEGFMPLLDADREREIVPFFDAFGVKKATPVLSGNFETAFYVGARTGFATGPLSEGAPGRNSDSLSYVASALWQDEDTRFGVRHINFAENEGSGLSSETTQIFGEQRIGPFLAAGEYNIRDGLNDTYTLTTTYDLSDTWDVTAFDTSERYGVETRYRRAYNTEVGIARFGIGGGLSCEKDKRCGFAAGIHLNFTPKIG